MGKNLSILQHERDSVPNKIRARLQGRKPVSWKIGENNFRRGNYK
jgi:hypothetical protein